MNQRIVVLSGGFSEERSVSIESSKAIVGALERNAYEVLTLDPADFPAPGSFRTLIGEIRRYDPLVTFIGLHGGSGENGQLQALLELEGLCFTGSGACASALCMDKYRSQQLVASIGLPVPATIVGHRGTYWAADCPGVPIPEAGAFTRFGFPLVVKPNNSGSSVGVTIVRELSEVESAVHKAGEYSPEILLQAYIPGRELTVAIVGEDPLPVVEIVPRQGFYDFENKYQSGRTDYHAPAELTDVESETLREFGRRIFLLHGCRGYGRVDFRYDGKAFHFLEVNTLPGMTSLSLAPKAAGVAGISFEALLEKIVRNALKETPGISQGG
jgi:D-alanine-D-alanine ligase